MAFIGVQAGTSFTEPNVGANPENPLDFLVPEPGALALLGLSLVSLALRSRGA